jgi:hypothetical protein
VKPILQALVVADRVYTDGATGKKIIAGTFNQIHKITVKSTIEERPDGSKVFKVPGGMQMGAPFAYLNLTEIHNKVDLLLRYVELTDNKVIFQTTITVSAPSPLVNAEVVAPLPTLPVEPAGPYALEVLWNDEHLGSHRIYVGELASPEESQ